MYANILVPVALDHDRDVSRALAVARRLAGDGAAITALTVLEALPAYILAELPEGQQQLGKDAAFSELTEMLGAEAGVRAQVVTGHSARSILDYAENHDIDCIVIASHRPGLQDYLLGSTAGRVVRHARCSVHVVR